MISQLGINRCPILDDFGKDYLFFALAGNKTARFVPGTRGSESDVRTLLKKDSGFRRGAAADFSPAVSTPGSSARIVPVA
jgi:hypothetical protein